MSDVTLSGPLPRLEHSGRVSLLHVARSEWTKLRTVRSTAWTLLVAIVLGIGFPLLFAAVTSSHWNGMRPHEQADRHPLDITLAGVGIGQLAVAVLGVLFITAEYSTGMIRATFTAVPKRLPVLWAKIGVFAVVTFALMLPTVLIAFFASQAILHSHNPPILQTSFSDPGVARTVIGGAVYLTLIGIFSLALGAIIRNTAGGISAFVGIFFVIPPLMLALPSSWQNAITPYLPSSAAGTLVELTPGSNDLHVWPGSLLFVGYCAGMIAIAAIMLRRRDT